MSVDGILAAGRATALARMRDMVRLYSQAPDSFDRVTGTTVPGVVTVLYEGLARVKAVAAAGEDTQAGEREVRLHEYQVSLPWSAPLAPGMRVLPGMRVEVTASPDARMTGLTLWVTGVQYGDQATAWRITTEDRS